MGNLLIVKKIIDGEIDGTLPLIGDDGVLIGKLVPISTRNADDKCIAQALTDWRNKNAEFFFTRFTATLDRTLEWIRNAFLMNEGRMLFLIYCGDDLVGHYGFKDLTAETVFLDNAMLGVRCSYPKIMVKAGRALIQWLFDTVGVSTVYGSMLADNAPALMMNKDIGFRIIEKVPLIESTTNGEAILSEAQGEGDEKIIKYCYKVAINRSDFKI